MAQPPPDRVGLAGLGTMGLPIARRLVAGGIKLGVWNRSPDPAALLADDGALVDESFAALLDSHDIVLLMLFDEAAADAVLARSLGRYARGRRCGQADRPDGHDLARL